MVLCTLPFPYHIFSLPFPSLTHLPFLITSLPLYPFHLKYLSYMYEINPWGKHSTPLCKLICKLISATFIKLAHGDSTKLFLKDFKTFFIKIQFFEVLKILIIFKKKVTKQFCQIIWKLLTPKEFTLPSKSHCLLMTTIKCIPKLQIMQFSRNI